MSKRNKLSFRSLIAAILLICFGVFVGAYIASDDIRRTVNSNVNDSKPVKYANEKFKQYGIDVAVELPYRHQAR